MVAVAVVVVKRLSASRETVRRYRPFLEAGLMTVGDVERETNFRSTLYKAVRQEGIVLGCTSCHGKPRSGRLYCADCSVIVKRKRRRLGRY